MGIAELVAISPWLCGPNSLHAMQEDTGLQNLPFLPALSSCCRTWLFPYLVRMGSKEVNKARGAHPNPCPHTHRSPHSQPTPAAGAEVSAGPCYLGWPCSGPSCLRCGACVDQSSGPWSLHVHGFMSIPRGAIGAVLAPCHAFGFSSTWCGAGVDPVVALMSPEILDRSAPGPGWDSLVPPPCLSPCWDIHRDPLGWGLQSRACTPGHPRKHPVPTGS